MGYILDICENYPFLVHSISWVNKDAVYDPITLSGVVADEHISDSNEEKLSIKFPEIVTLHIILCTTKKENSPTAFGV